MESIKRLRKSLRVSLGELARRTGLHRTHIARVERAGVDVRASTLLAVARGLRVPVCKLFGKEGQHERRAARSKRRGRR